MDEDHRVCEVIGVTVGSQPRQPRSGVWHEDRGKGAGYGEAGKEIEGRPKPVFISWVRDLSFLAGRSTFQMSPYRLRPA